MNTIIEEIRKRIEARKKNTYHAGDYDEYADGIVVGLSYALGIIDEVEKEHPVPAEEGKILPKLREFLATATPEELEAKYRELEYLLAPKDEDADKAAEMAARRAYPYDGGTKGYICEASIPIFCKGFKAGIAYERERLMKEAAEIDTDITINRYTKRHILHISSTDEHIQHLPQGEYKAIIIKKEK